MDAVFNAFLSRTSNILWLFLLRLLQLDPWETTRNGSLHQAGESSSIKPQEELPDQLKENGGSGCFGLHVQLARSLGYLKLLDDQGKRGRWLRHIRKLIVILCILLAVGMVSVESMPSHVSIFVDSPGSCTL